MLILAAVLNGILALLHLGIIVVGAPGYRYFRAPESYAQAALAGNPRPAFITLGIALVFGVWAAYALSGAGVLPPLPGLVPALWAIVAIYLLRGLLLVLQLFGPATILGQEIKGPPRDLVFSACALVIGLIHALGAWRSV
jgi:hypothetical protein